MGATAGAAYALPRDRATDQANLVELQTIGLAVRDPQTGELVPVNPAWNLGRQVSLRSPLSKVGRPDFQREDPQLVMARDLRKADPVNYPPGAVRRNVEWPAQEVGGRGWFSWAANRSSDGVGRGFQVTGVAEYFITSLHLQLARALPWVVAGPKPAIPAGVTGQHAHIELGHSTGWPVVAPQVPSYSVRVPLLRPRGLVSQT